jgi:TolB-like protein
MELLDSKVHASAYGGRLYWSVGQFGRLLPYVCAEGDYGGFDDGTSKASGYLGGLFAGLEYFPWRRFSVQVDFGPAYVSLTGDSATTSSLHYILSFGLTYYLGQPPRLASEPSAMAPSATEQVTPASEAPAAKPAEPPSGGMNVAVADLSAQGVSASDAAVITDMIRSVIVKFGKFNVVEKANMDRILSEQAFQQTGCTSEECAVKLGKLLNVNRMVVGSFGKLLTRYVVNVRVVNVENGKVLFSDEAMGDDVDRLMGQTKAMAERVAKGIK